MFVRLLLQSKRTFQCVKCRPVTSAGTIDGSHGLRCQEVDSHPVAPAEGDAHVADDICEIEMQFLIVRILNDKDGATIPTKDTMNLDERDLAIPAKYCS
jgi:hypothetical protein